MIAGSSISASPIASAPNDRKEPSIGVSLSEKQVFGVEGTGVGIVTIDVGISETQKQSFGFIPLSIPTLGVTESEKRAYGVEWFVSGTATPTLGIALTEHETFGWIADYLIEGVPIMTASRSGTTVTIDLDNLENTPVSIWKTDGHRSNFTFVDNYEVSEFPIEITGVTGDAKFKGAFAVVAIRGGSESISSGQRARSNFTIN